MESYLAVLMVVSSAASLVLMRVDRMVDLKVDL